MHATHAACLGRLAAMALSAGVAAAAVASPTRAAPARGARSPGLAPGPASAARGADAGRARPRSPVERYWSATSPALGALAYPRDFSAFVLGDVVGEPAAEGPVGAGGDVRLGEAHVNARGLAVGVVAGRDVSAARGAIAGAIVHGGSVALGAEVAAAGARERARALDFDWAEAELLALSDALAARPSSGRVVLERWGGIALAGADPALNVFEVSGAALERAPTVEISAPAGAVVIVNVRGGRAAFDGCGLTLTGGADRGHLLWNLAGAAELRVRAAAVPGSVLAPRAAVVLVGATIQGTLVAGSLRSAAGTLQYQPFVGFDAARGAVRPGAGHQGTPVASASSFIAGSIDR